MKQMFYIKVLFIFLCWWMLTAMQQDISDEQPFTGSIGYHPLDDQITNSNNCNCGMEGENGDSAAYDQNPPVFNFSNQIYQVSYNGPVSGNGKDIISGYNEVFDAGRALGQPDGNGANIKSDGKLTIKLKDMLPAGTQYQVYWRQETGQYGFSEMQVYESKSLSEWSANNAGTLSTENENYFATTLTADTDLRYIMLKNPGKAFIRIDAVTYTISSADMMVSMIVPHDTINCAGNIPMPLVTDDCDATVEIDYDDSVGEGSCFDGTVIKRKYTATDNCGNIAFAEQTIVMLDRSKPASSNIQQVTTVPVTKNKSAWFTAVSFTNEVVEANKALGVPDAMGAKIKSYGRLTVQLIDLLPAGTQYKIYWRKEGNQPGAALMRIMESANTSNWSLNSAINLSTEDENYFVTTLTAGTATRYIKMWSQGTPDIRIDAVTYTIPEVDMPNPSANVY